MFKCFHILSTCVVILFGIASQVNADVLEHPARLELEAVVGAINFGTITDRSIGGVIFRAAPANSTVAGLRNRAIGAVGVKQHQQTLPEVGSTNDEIALEQILGTSIFDQSGEKSIKPTLDIPNGFYRAQLVIYDGRQSVIGNHRDGNQFVQGILVASHYDDFAEQAGTSPIVAEPDKDKARWFLFSTEVFLKQFGETDSNFQPIFNDKDLTGWDGDPKTWHVKDGAISCSGKAGDTWLIWRGGELEDFELRLQFRHVFGNSGVQVRSIEDKKWSVVGYQAEIAAQANVGLWHQSKAPEKYRLALSNAGEKGHITNDGGKTLTRLAPAEKVGQAFLPCEWNEMVIGGQGPKLIQTGNGVVLSELVDLDGKHGTNKGLLAFQDHDKGTVVQFRNIRLKQLSAVGEESQDNPIDSGKADTERE